MSPVQSAFDLLTSPSGAAAAMATHLFGIAGFAAYATGQAHLLWYYFTRRPRGSAPALPPNRAQWPRVTVQVPMYNERYVAAAVMDACAALDWPRDRFELQVLDDSEDDTVSIVDERAAHWRARGVDVAVVRRANRTGFKAGALAHGSQSARGDFHALFDADFRPYPDFLLRTIGWFSDPHVAAVQARWGHLNRNWNWLTRAQAMVIDAFFVVEQEARDRAGFVLRFNGSAGIWRAAAIADAGGWQADTLSEDYDLCLRAQVRGWKFVYARDVVAPAELPVTVHDYKVQQTRWARGRGQVIRKLLGTLLRAPLRPMAKVHAVFDMLNILVVPAVLVVLLSSPWLVLALAEQPTLRPLAVVVGVAQLPINLLVLPTYLWLAMRSYREGAVALARQAGASVPAFVSLMMGINLVVFTAGVSGVSGRIVPFRRTSKYNIVGIEGTWRKKLYRPGEVSLVTWGEGAIALMVVVAIAIDLAYGGWFWLPFHVISLAGFGLLFALSFVRR